jgi:small subunit ribosomal protein S6
VRKYEIMLILPPDAGEDVVAGATDRISTVITQQGGEITNLDRWGKRRFAHEIDRKAEGFYIVVECMADPASITELDRVLSLADEIVRFKVVVRAA